MTLGDAIPAGIHHSYTPLLGRELEGMSFMPMTNSDTDGVMAARESSTVWFSGAVCLGFMGAADLFVTWWNRGDDFALVAGAETGWARFSLDSVVMSQLPPWNVLESATLRRVHLFAGRPHEPKLVAAVKHEFQSAECVTELWIAVGYASLNRVGDGDDLYFGLKAPSNASELLPLQKMEC